MSRKEAYLWARWAHEWASLGLIASPRIAAAKHLSQQSTSTLSPAQSDGHSSLLTGLAITASTRKRGCALFLWWLDCSYSIQMPQLLLAAPSRLHHCWKDTKRTGDSWSATGSIPPCVLPAILVRLVDFKLQATVQKSVWLCGLQGSVKQEVLVKR